MPAQSPGPVPKEALSFFRDKKLYPAFDYLDVWKEEHGYAFTVAKLMEVDVLDFVRNEIDKAIVEGTTFQSWQKTVKARMMESGWGDDVKAKEQSSRHRLRIIFDTNLRTARAAGQWERIQRTKKAMPYLLYELGPSEHHRPEHADWAGTLLPADDSFWETHFAPNGWLCKCHISQIGRREFDKLGGATDRPPLNNEPWTNPKTGKVEQIPKGIDPGFNYNFGKDRVPDSWGK